MSTILDWFRSNHPQKKEEEKKPVILIDTEGTLTKKSIPEPKPHMIGLKENKPLTFKSCIKYETAMTIGWPFDILKSGDLIMVIDFPDDPKEWTLTDTRGNKLTPELSLLLYNGTDLTVVCKATISTIKFKVTMSNSATFTHYTFDETYDIDALTVINSFIKHLPKEIHVEAYADDELIMDSCDTNVFYNYYFNLKMMLEPLKPWGEFKDLYFKELK